MKAIEIIADVDDQHRLHADVPKDVPPGPVRVFLFLPNEDEAGARWAEGVAREWSSELSDPAEDIYTLEDGQPVDAPR